MPWPKYYPEKGVITDPEFKAKMSSERANNLAVLKRMH
jgi:hypothetical protein